MFVVWDLFNSLFVLIDSPFDNRCWKVLFQCENLIGLVEIFSHFMRTHIFVMIWDMESWVIEYEPNLHFSSKKDNLFLFVVLSCMYKILLSVATKKWFQDTLETLPYKDVQLQEERNNAAFSLENRDYVRGKRCHASWIQTLCASQGVYASSLTQSRDCMCVTRKMWMQNCTAYANLLWVPLSQIH